MEDYCLARALPWILLFGRRKGRNHVCLKKAHGNTMERKRLRKKRRRLQSHSTLVLLYLFFTDFCFTMGKFVFPSLFSTFSIDILAHLTVEPYLIHSKGRIIEVIQLLRFQNALRMSQSKMLIACLIVELDRTHRSNRNRMFAWD